MTLKLDETWLQSMHNKLNKKRLEPTVEKVQQQVEKVQQQVEKVLNNM